MDKKTKEIKKEVKVCSAKYIDGNIFLDFDGFGITVENKLELSSDKVKVLYQGEIGTPDFSFEVVK